MTSKSTINHTDLEIAPLNFGGNVFGWTLDEKESFRILDAFVAAGFNFIDTADTYPWWVNGTGGLSETIIGKWMRERGNRDDLVIATKVGSETKEHPKDISREHIMRSVEESLHRLQTDRIDLYYTHFDDEKTLVEETLAAYDAAIKAGKVRHIGASNVPPERITRTMDLAEKSDLPRYVALQPHYNLLVREDLESRYAPLVERFGFSVFPYWSLASGFLTGKYRSEEDFEKTQRGGSVKKYFDDRGKAILEALDTVAARHETTCATVAIAWLLANPLVTAPIASATSETQLQTLFDAVKLELDAEDMERLDIPAED